MLYRQVFIAQRHPLGVGPVEQIPEGSAYGRLATMGFG